MTPRRTVLPSHAAAGGLPGRALAAICCGLAAWAGAACASPDSYDMAGTLAGVEGMQMEFDVQADGRVRGYYFLESSKRPRLLEGRLDAKTGNLQLEQFDARCNVVARLQGVLKERALSGSLSSADGGPALEVDVSEHLRSMVELNGIFRCHIEKSQFTSTLEMAIQRGTLSQFTYLTNFVGGQHVQPWYCAVNSLDPGFEVRSEGFRSVVRDAVGGSGCRIVVRDTGNLIKVRFAQCDSFCVRTALPHSLLIDKRTDQCAEFAVPQGQCLRP